MTKIRVIRIFGEKLSPDTTAEINYTARRDEKKMFGVLCSLQAEFSLCMENNAGLLLHKIITETEPRFSPDSRIIKLESSIEETVIKGTVTNLSTLDREINVYIIVETSN